MSKKNKERNVPICVICEVRSAQEFSLFCKPCVTEHRAEALTHINMEDTTHDPRVDTLRNRARGWW